MPKSAKYRPIDVVAAAIQLMDELPPTTPITKDMLARKIGCSRPQLTYENRPDLCEVADRLIECDTPFVLAQRDQRKQNRRNQAA
jgi:predicted secreted Zn-dependent protease